MLASAAEQPEFQSVAWSPGALIGGLWYVLSALLTLAGIGLFAALSALATGRQFLPIHQDDGSWAMPVVLGILALLLIGHEMLHGLVMRSFGACPMYGAAMAARVLPVFYCTANGHRFTRLQYAAAALAPVVLISLIGGALVVLAPFGYWLVIPLGLHFGGSTGDLWALGLILRQPRGTLIEDLKAGVVFHRPTAYIALA